MTKSILYFVLIAVCLIKLAKSANLQFATCKNNESCVPFRECEKVIEILKKGSVLSSEDRTYMRQIQCKVENHIPYVCCQSNVNLEDKLPKAPKCGMQFTNKIVGGREADIDEYPWTVQIYHKTEKGEIESFCGGVLINERYVLTAAHCTQLNLIKVRLGDWDTTTNPDCQADIYEEQRCNDPYVEIEIENIIVHEDYNASSRMRYNDIALIKLKENVTFSSYIKPICLPIDDFVRNMNMTGHHVEVAGFGLTNLASRTSSVRKMKLGLKINPQRYCEEIYARYDVVLNSKQICAGGEKGKDTCNGDSGGALMKQINNRGRLSYYALVGLVSFGPAECGTLDHPAVYTKVSEYVQWIANNMD
ncbi:CLIP domain-containing serine protease B4-like [Chironomus tepperi]|uniref:CLIP domain-containing serine protease B4-like n=1 Tax=Chironomus tepperi TaxID=113505 RepID=UPI00391FC76E